MKRLKRQLTKNECERFLKKDGSIDREMKIRVKINLHKLEGYDKGHYERFMKAGNYPRKKKKFYKKFFEIYFLFPLSFRKLIYR